MLIKKNKSPLYKKFHRLNENVQNQKKLLKFKKQKWVKLIKAYKKKLKRYKIYKPYDQVQYLVSKYPSKYLSYKTRYKNLLNCTKKLRLFYGNLSTESLKKYILSAYSKLKRVKNINLLLITELESRLDTVLYRSKFCFSFLNARQLIKHGKVFVNKTAIKNGNFKLKAGDIISINPKDFKSIIVNIKKSLMWPIPPKHLIINYKIMQIIFREIEDTNFSIYFSFHLNLELITEHTRI